jgi:hypothetical protein
MNEKTAVKVKKSMTPEELSIRLLAETHLTQREMPKLS